jgi:hypothetical protein
MIKSDFPSKWPQFINQILTCLSTDNIETWNSALLVFYTLVQYFEYMIFMCWFFALKLMMEEFLGIRKWKIEFQWMML